MTNISRQIDWSLTTWEWSRQEQVRRWADLPLESIILAQEEMQKISDWLQGENPGDNEDK